MDVIALRPRLQFAAALLSGCLALAVAAELALRVLPTGGWGTDMVDGYGTAHPLRHVPGTPLRYSRDWDFLYAQRGHINQMGYHGHCELSADSQGGQVWVTGDSFAASLMVPADQSLGAALARELPPGLKVCMVGAPGAPGSEFLASLPHFSQGRSADRWIIILNSGDIPESTGNQTGTGWHQWTPALDGALTGTPRPPAPRWLLALRESHLYRYVSYNLLVSHTLASLQQQVRRITTLLPGVPAAPANSEISDALHSQMAQLWVDQLALRAQASQARPLVILNAFDQRHARAEVKDLERRRLAELAGLMARRGIPHVSVTELFASPECRRQGSCYLFRDGHWHPTGARLIATAVAQKLKAE